MKDRNRRTKVISEFARSLLREWHRLGLSKTERVLVAVSGGADSTALLLGLDELDNVGKLSLEIFVVHLDHGLRKGASEDAEWVTQLSKRLGHEAIVASANIRKKARETADNLEQAARRARYDFFLKTAKDSNANVVLTAHTLDDQAETILMRLMRGSGAEGLSGIAAKRPVTEGSSLLVVRPLLSWSRRADTEQYCRTRRVRFRVDEMNDDERFARVRIRKQLLPLMQSFNNRVVEGLARTASLLREDALALSKQAESLLADAADATSQGTLSVAVLAGAPAAIRRRALRQWICGRVGHLRRVEMVHLIAIEKLLETNRGRTVELPNGTRITRKQGRLALSVKKVEKGHSDL
jgi:tRNA(Ile)-lysidine synthase